MTEEITNHIPQAKSVAKSHSISPIWVIPIIALFIGAWLVFQSSTEKKFNAEVTFKSAAGLEAGKTAVKLRNVKIGELTDVKFTEDLSEVVVVMELTGVSSEMLTDTTRFWVVKPRIGVGGVSGLDTLLSGAYIEIDPGKGGTPKNKFTGLEEPQLYQLGNPGTKYKLKSHKLGSLNRGSPIKYRGITVGSITRYKLIEDHSYVEIDIFINSPHDKYVTQHSRFWNTSGASMELDAKGFDFRMESIGSLISGGIAYTNAYIPAADKEELHLAKAGQLFTLYATEAPDITERVTFGAPIKLYFENGVSGLSAGAAVEYKGIQIGTVLQVGVEQNKNQNNIVTFAMIEIEPERLPSEDLNEHLTHKQRIENVYQFFNHMVKQGVRGQLKSNFLTGQSLVVFEVFADAKPAKIKLVEDYIIVPTVPETVTGLIKQINELLARLRSVPIESIGTNLDEATANINTLIQSLNAEEGGMTGMQVNEALNELNRAARSIRAMSEYLERHPEALLTGKHKEQR
jgi:paraquat-inducible protein B